MRKSLFLGMVLLLLLATGQASASSGFYNAGFETGDFSYWTTGPYTIASVITGDAAYATTPKEGTQMAMISFPGEQDGGFLDTNFIEQRIDPGAKEISLWYRFFSTESYPGYVPPYDSPAFTISINGIAVLSLNYDASNVIFDGVIWNTVWTQFTWDVSGLPGDIILRINAGNNGMTEEGQPDNSFNSWVYIDDVKPAYQAVPLPSAISLLGPALAGLAFLRRYRGEDRG